MCVFSKLLVAVSFTSGMVHAGYIAPTWMYDQSAILNWFISEYNSGNNDHPLPEPSPCTSIHAAFLNPECGARRLEGNVMDKLPEGFLENFDLDFVLHEMDKIVEKNEDPIDRLEALKDLVFPSKRRLDFLGLKTRSIQAPPTTVPPPTTGLGGISGSGLDKSFFGRTKSNTQNEAQVGTISAEDAKAFKDFMTARKRRLQGKEGPFGGFSLGDRSTNSAQMDLPALSKTDLALFEGALTSLPTLKKADLATFEEALAQDDTHASKTIRELFKRRLSSHTFDRTSEKGRALIAYYDSLHAFERREFCVRYGDSLCVVLERASSKSQRRLEGAMTTKDWGRSLVTYYNALPWEDQQEFCVRYGHTGCAAIERVSRAMGFPSQRRLSKADLVNLTNYRPSGQDDENEAQVGTMSAEDAKALKDFLTAPKRRLSKGQASEARLEQLLRQIAASDDGARDVATPRSSTPRAFNIGDLKTFGSKVNGVQAARAPPRDFSIEDFAGLEPIEEGESTLDSAEIENFVESFQK